MASPFFDPFENLDLMNPDPIMDKTIVDKSYPYNLGFEIPALSFAAGGTVSEPFSLRGKAKNMNDEMVDDEQAWPKSRLDGRQRAWWHNDFHDVAYRYTYKLFDSFVKEGALDDTK